MDPDAPQTHKDGERTEFGSAFNLTSVAVDSVCRVVRETVLILSDDEAAKSQIVACLDAAGYRRFDVHSSAEAAWSALRQTPFDLVVVDWEMSCLSGMGCYNRIRGDERTVWSPVVIWSDVLTPADLSLMESGFPTQLNPKPFAPEPFAQAAREVRSKSQTCFTAFQEYGRAVGELESCDDEAIVPILEDLVKTFPHGGCLAFEAGRYFLEQGSYRYAEDLLNLADESLESPLSVNVELAKLYSKTQRSDQLDGLVDQFCDITPQRLERLMLLNSRGLTFSHPDGTSSHFEVAFRAQHKARHCALGGKENSLVAHLKNSHARPPLSEQLVSALNMIGVLHVRQKRYDEAIGLYFAALCFATDENIASRLRHNLHLAYRKKGDLDEAARWKRLVADAAGAASTGTAA